MVNFVNPRLGIFVNRYKRFFATMNIDMKDHVCYCPNTGKMSDILIPGNECIISDTLKGSPCWQAIKQEDTWVGVNTMNPNRLIEKILPEIFPGQNFRREVKFGGYRADFASEYSVVEVKHVHWKQDEIALFPDCITSRGTRQMNDLFNLQEQGYKCYVIYVLQRNDIEKVVSSEVDIKYQQAAKRARECGVEFMAFNCNINETGISINKKIHVL
jgi:sugar fermentation stimulation protein A